MGQSFLSVCQPYNPKRAEAAHYGAVILSTPFAPETCFEELCCQTERGGNKPCCWWSTGNAGEKRLVLPPLPDCLCLGSFRHEAGSRQPRGPCARNVDDGGNVFWGPIPERRTRLASYCGFRFYRFRCSCPGVRMMTGLVSGTLPQCRVATIANGLRHSSTPIEDRIADYGLTVGAPELGS
jgi:hypothetical protein